MSSRPLVVFIDDDRFYAIQWIEVLRERFNVLHIRNAEEARGFVLGTEHIKCIVLDVMMPTPSNASRDETAKGLETGLWLLRQIASRVTKLRIPVVLLTNRDIERVKTEIQTMKFPEDLVEAHRKIDTPRKRLLEIVRNKVTQFFGEAP